MTELGKKRRMLAEDDLDPPPQPAQRKWKFPKGKKAKMSDDDGAVGLKGEGGEEYKGWMDPKLAAKERAWHRGEMREEEVLGNGFDKLVEVQYEDNTNFEDDGIRIEPFNLEQEREEGYFDSNGNFIEYAKEHEVKDAWLDNLEVDSRFAKKIEKKVEEEVYEDLSSDDVGKIKRSIANTLEPGETIIQALKRLKGKSDERGKMSDVTKRIFDQLTEDAMKLMENGEYNVYHEKREIFEREAEGYERLARAREDASSGASSGTSDFWHREDAISDSIKHKVLEPSIWDVESGTSAANVTAPQGSSGDGGDTFDMFGEDENEDENLQSVSNAAEPANGETGSDYIYDEASGYYYSSSLGYFYDPASGMYASATTGTWYIFDEQSGSYTEVQNSQPQEVTGD